MLETQTEVAEVIVPIGHQMIIKFSQEKLGNMIKAQMFMEYEDKDIKKFKLEQLKNIENTAYIRIAGHERVYARGSDEINVSETASIHNILFDFKPGEVVDFKDEKNTIVLGISHDFYPYEMVLKDHVKELLRKCLN
jgi:predicted transcriptional regulator